jgi:uncharacterized protein (DUF433 family)
VEIVSKAIDGGAAISRGELPRYAVSEVAAYLHIPEKTLRSWVFGRLYTVRGISTFSPPLIQAADPERSLLSFYNLVEAHILRSTRDRDEVPMRAIRDALDYSMSKNQSPHPLLTRGFLTEGRYLFEKQIENQIALIINSTMQGQIAFGDLLSSYLERIDRDTIDSPLAVYPFIPNKPSSRVVVIKPGVSSGVPTVAGTGISIPILHSRFIAGDSVEDLADDYEIGQEEVEDALNYIKAA